MVGTLSSQRGDTQARSADLSWWCLYNILPLRFPLTLLYPWRSCTKGRDPKRGAGATAHAALWVLTLTSVPTWEMGAPPLVFSLLGASNSQMQMQEVGLEILWESYFSGNPASSPFQES